jgi:hypothetical protein
MFLNILPNLLLIGLFVIYFLDLRSIINFEVTSPTFLPIIVSITIAALNIMEIIRKLVIAKEWKIGTMFKKNDKHVLLLIIIIWIYIWSLPKLGFVISSAVAVFVFSLLWLKTIKNIGKKKFIIVIAISIGFPFSLVYFFERILKINLP